MVVMSIGGPFYDHWTKIISFVTAGEDGGNDSDLTEPTAWDELWFYVTLASMGVVTIFEMILQVTILPQVFAWIDEVETIEVKEVIYL